MRLGIFGGTFNPIHIGHLRVAQEVCEILGLDRLVFVPAKLPPHKSAENLADAAERLKLVKLAVAGNPFFSVSDVELLREGPSYSVDTVRHFSDSERPEELWFVMGGDQYRELHTWRNYRDVVRMADIAVMRRPGHGERLLPPRGLEEEYSPSGEGFVHMAGRVIRPVEVTQMDISSTMIRRALDEGRSIRYLVPEAVFMELSTKRKG